jgi:hypothetical protein
MTLYLKTIPFTKTDIKEYLDRCIEFWRAKREAGDVLADSYIDAFQSVRTTIFGEVLPVAGEGQTVVGPVVRKNPHRHKKLDPKILKAVNAEEMAERFLGLEVHVNGSLTGEIVAMGDGKIQGAIVNLPEEVASSKTPPLPPEKLKPDWVFKSLIPTDMPSQSDEGIKG